MQNFAALLADFHPIALLFGAASLAFVSMFGLALAADYKFEQGGKGLPRVYALSLLGLVIGMAFAVYAGYRIAQGS